MEIIRQLLLIHYLIHMDIKNFKIILPIIVAVISVSSRCNKDKTIPCPNLQTAYNFSVTSQWMTEKEVYQLGDTIYLSSFFSKTLTDQINPSMNVNYSNSVGITGVIGLVFLDSINRQFIPAKDSFLFVNIEGSFNENESIQNRTKVITFSEQADKYRFSGGIVCMKKGVYEIDVDNLYSPGLRGTKCTSAGFEMNVTNVNKHINLFESAIGQTPTIVRQKIMYCFRVR
jgi:hypothetical protein